MLNKRKSIVFSEIKSIVLLLIINSIAQLLITLFSFFFSSLSENI